MSHHPYHDLRVYECQAKQLKNQMVMLLLVMIIRIGRLAAAASFLEAHAASTSLPIYYGHHHHMSDY
jgi:hypothetical protein